ncbi:MAG: hypothetical protein K2R98_27200 [Gemmataceae bacterium]|nr:hypothetical protein [Gemmataceae bacterium]
MTEAEWLACTNPDVMLEHLDGKASVRKLRLHGCACCRRMWHLLSDERSRAAIETSERFADDQCSKEDLAAAHKFAVAAIWTTTGLERDAAQAAAWVAAPHAWDAADATGRVAAKVLAVSSGCDDGLAKERDAQVALLREIMGNPYQPMPFAAALPPDLISIARSVYAGADRRQPLQAALKEVGQPALAEHFATPGHPKGCWVLDALLGRQ